MAFTKVSEKITTPNELAGVVRAYLTVSGHFTLHKLFTATHFSLRHKNGKYFVFEFGNERANDFVNCFLSFTEPTQDIIENSSLQLGGMRKITYPLLNLYLTTTETFIAISAEIRSGVFRHILVGRMQSYANREDGEFVYSTNSTYENISYNSVHFDANSASYYLNKQLVDYYHASGIVGIQYTPYSKYQNYVAYKGNLVVSSAGGYNKIARFFSPPPTNILVGSMNFNGRSPLNTHHLIYSEGNSELFYTPVFYCNELATIAIDNLNPADIVLDDWIVFPVMTKLTNINSDEVSTGNLGVAFKFK
jgi:hypothetical protein|nr:MAG TPA: hypothetical protein [Caudoviricetes sp.]